GSDRWLIYTASPSGNTYGGLLSGNQALYGRTFTSDPPALITQLGNRYIFAEDLPSLTVAVATNLIGMKVYGDSYVFPEPVIGTNYTISGFVNAAAFGGVFTQDNITNIGLTGAPVFSSPGAAPTAPASDNAYPLNIAVGSLANTAGYTFGNFVPGRLFVTPRPLTITAKDQFKPVGVALDLDPITGITVQGLQNGETIGSVVLSSDGAPASAPVGVYSIDVSSPVGGTADLTNYRLLVEPGRLTVASVSGQFVYDEFVRYRDNWQTLSSLLGYGSDVLVIRPRSNDEVEEESTEETDALSEGQNGDDDGEKRIRKAITMR
ncbi:MAG: hypothetical protein EA381_19655, partial [Planctomycetaceae bacterium]